MTTNRVAELLRKRESPQRPTFLELFFDLVYVFALTRIGDELAEDFTRPGVADKVTESYLRDIRCTACAPFAEGGEVLLLLLAIWWIWTQTAWMTSRSDPYQPAIQFVVLATMLGSLFMAVALPEAMTESGLLFAGSYVAIQVGRTLFFSVAFTRRGHDLERADTRVGGTLAVAGDTPGARPWAAENLRALVWFGVSAVPWLAGAFTQGATRVALWALAVAIDYVSARFSWPVPGLGRSRREHVSPWAAAGEHLAERHWQLVIVALGETILVTGAAYVSGQFMAERTWALVVSFVTSVLLWRIYFYRAGQILGEAIASSANPSRHGRSAEVAHLLMVAGIMSTAAGYELVLKDPLGHAQPTWVAVILGGPGLYLAGRSIFEYVVFARVSRPRPIGILILTALMPAMVGLPPLAVAVAAASVLIGVAISDAIRARGRPLEQASPPR